jgi:hypothetical protein
MVLPVRSSTGACTLSLINHYMPGHPYAVAYGFEDLKHESFKHPLVNWHRGVID